MSISEEPLIIDVPEENKMVDVEKALADKNPRLLKLMPKPVLNYVKRTVRQDQINSVIYRNRDKKGWDFLDGVLSELGVNISVNGIEHIPKEGGVFLAANHPMGGLDGMAFMHVVGSVRKDFKFFVNDILMQVDNLVDNFIPVNVFGDNSEEYRQAFNAAYTSKEAVLIFPAGMVSRRHRKPSSDQIQKTGKKHIEDLLWKRSIVEKAAEFKKDIIPVHIKGFNSKRFYNVGYYRKKVFIEANIEMFYLPDELFTQRGNTIHFEIGKPIPGTHFDNTKTSAEWVQWLKEHVYGLGQNNLH